MHSEASQTEGISEVWVSYRRYYEDWGSSALPPQPSEGLLETKNSTFSLLLKTKTNGFTISKP